MDALIAILPVLECNPADDSSDDEAVAAQGELHSLSASAGGVELSEPSHPDTASDSGSDMESVAHVDDEDGDARAAETFGDDSDAEIDTHELEHTAGVNEGSSERSRCCIRDVMAHCSQQSK